METEYIRDRITTLRIKKGISEHRMSLDLGKSKGYIHRISSGKCLPSVKELYAICDYLEVSLVEFFDDEVEDAEQLTRLKKIARHLTSEDLLLLNKLAERMDTAESNRKL